MAKRGTIIEIRIDNQDALNRLGKQQAELLKVRESIKLLNSIIQENGKANNNQARQLGELNVKQQALRKSTSTLAKDLAAVGVASRETADAARVSALETLKQTGALKNLDASLAKNVGQLGRWKEEQILVGKAQADLRKEVRANSGATDQQRQDLDDLATKAKFLSSNLNELTNDTAGLTAAGTRFRDKMAAATLEALKQSGVIGQLDARTVALTADIDKLNAQFEAGTVDTAQYTANLDKLTKELDQTKAATAASEARFNALEAEFRQGKISADQFRASVDLLNKEVKTQGGLLQSGVNDLKSYVIGTIGVVAASQAAGRIISDAAKTIADFDEGLAKIRALGADYAASIDAIGEAARTAGINFGFTATESLAAVEALAKAGLTTEQILAGGLTQSLALAAAGTVELGTAAEFVASTLSQFGLDGKDAGQVVDGLAAAAVKGQGDVEDFANALKFVGPVAASLNVSVQETIGTLAVFAEQGIKGEQAGTTLRGVLSSLTSPSKEATKELERLGIVTADGNKLFDEASGKFLGLANLAEQLRAATADLTEEERAQALGRIFGNQQITGATVLLKDGKKAVEEWTQAVTDEGFAEEVAQKKTDNLKGAITRIKLAYNALLLQDKGIGGFFKRRADEIGNFLNVLAGNDPRSKSIQAFTDKVNEEYKKIGGTATLAAAEGGKVTEQLRLLADNAKAIKNDDPFGIDLLVVQGRKATEVLRGIVAQREKLKGETGISPTFDANLKVEEAAARATIQIITDQLNARTAASKKEVAAIGAVSTAVTEGAKTTTDALGSSIDETNKDTDAKAKNATETKAVAGSVADLNAQLSKLKALQDQEPGKAQFDEYSKQIAGVQEQLDALTKTASAVAFDPLTPPDTVGLKSSTQEGPLNFDATQAQSAADALVSVKEQEAADLERLREDARVRDIEGIVDLNAEKLLLQKEFEAGSEMSQAEYNARVAALDEELARQKRAAIASVGDALAAFSTLAKKGSAEQKALATAAALVNTYLGVSQVLANPTVIPEPFGTINKIASIATVLATGLAAVRQIQSVQGFAEGGIIQEKHGKPIRRSNGDNRVITAKVDEMILTEEQQREIKRRAGFDIFRLAGVPGANGSNGFIEGGVVSSTLRGSVRGTALVNLGAAPSPGLLDTLQTNAISRAADPNIFVRVTDIDNVQGQRARVLDRATL